MPFWMAVDQFGNKTVLDDIRYKTLRKTFNAGSIKPMYIDRKDGSSRHIGFVLGQGRGNVSLWITLFQMKRLDEVREDN